MEVVFCERAIMSRRSFESGLSSVWSFHQVDLLSGWPSIRVICWDDLSPRFFFCAATFHQGGLCQDDLLLKRSFTETVFHQDGVLSDRSFIMVSLSSGWSLSVWFLIAWSLVWGGVSFIKTALDRTACHQSSLSSRWSFASCMTKVYFWFSLN